VFTIPHWTFARHEARGGDADLFMVTDKSAFERLDLVREEMECAAGCVGWAKSLAGTDNSHCF